MEKLYRVKSVASQLDVSVSTVWNLVASGKLAKPKKLTANISAWTESQLKDYIESL